MIVKNLTRHGSLI